MTTSRARSGAAVSHGIPQNLKEDGTPYTIVTTTTHQKMDAAKMNAANAPVTKLTSDDLEDAYWNVYVQTPKGFQFAEKLKGRPWDPDIRDLFGPGVYKSYPIGPDGKPIESLEQFHKVLDVSEVTQGKKPEANTGSNGKVDPLAGPMGTGDEKMPAWMRYQLQRTSEEAADARRRAEEAELRKEEWERNMRERQFEREERERREAAERREAEARERRERYDREERERREREERERQYRADKERRDAENARARNEQLATLASAGVSVVTSFLESRSARESSPQTDINARMLELFAAQNKSKNDGGSLKDQIEILLALDQLRKPEDGGSAKSDDDGLLSGIMGALPALAAMRGGGQAQQAPQAAAPAMMPPGMGGGGGNLTQALTDPNAVAQAAMQNPSAVASSLVTAVKGNPMLRQAVMTAFEQMGD